MDTQTPIPRPASLTPEVRARRLLCSKCRTPWEWADDGEGGEVQRPVCKCVESSDDPFDRGSDGITHCFPEPIKEDGHGPQE